MEKVAAKRKKPAKANSAGRIKQVAAGEFKAKCLRLIDEVTETGQEVVITKRGRPMAKLVPLRDQRRDVFFGRLKGMVDIVGDPDELINPAFALEDWDMLKCFCSIRMF